MPDSNIHVNVEPGTSEHKVEVDTEAPIERRKHASPVNVSVGSAGLSGIWGIVGNLTAVVFVMGMFYLMFINYTGTIKDQLQNQRDQMKQDRLDYNSRDESRDKAFHDRFDAMILNQQAANQNQQMTNREIRNATSQLEESNKSLKESVKLLTEINKKAGMHY